MAKLAGGRAFALRLSGLKLARGGFANEFCRASLQAVPHRLLAGRHE